MQCEVINQYSVSPLNLLTTFDCVFFTFIEQNYHIIHLPKGRWLFELWGASGGYSLYQSKSEDPGHGAYISGVINIKHNITLYGYVGGKGKNNSSKNKGIGGFNGGANGANDEHDFNCYSGGGGGATDIRLNIDDLYSRIIVAGGGGSPGCFNQGKGGSGGTIFGKDGENSSTNQGGKGANNLDLEMFGKGKEGYPGNEAGGSGGGGYFGGYGGGFSPSSTKLPGGGGGGGGSSYASGCDSCKTIYKDNSTQGNLHYSGYSFTNIIMRSGDDLIPIYDNSGITYTPHKDDGLIKITKYQLYDEKECQTNFSSHFLLNKHFLLSSLFIFLSYLIS